MAIESFEYWLDKEERRARSEEWRDLVGKGAYEHDENDVPMNPELHDQAKKLAPDLTNG